jgi:hypothetical protein
VSDYASAQASDADGARVKNPDDSPIILSRVGCPVCRTVNEYETVRPGSYVEDGIDTDFRPLTRRWSNPRYQSVNPLLYFMATCTTCFYTREFNRLFREQAAESDLAPERQKAMRLKHLAMLAESGSVAQRLGSSLWPESFPVQTAISKLLIGILDENLLERPSNYDLARWYLRTAWLFREAKPHNRPDLTSPFTHSRRDLECVTDEMQADLVRLSGRVSHVMQFLHSHPEAAQKHPDDSQGPLRCRQGLQQFVDQVSGMQETLAEVRRSLTAAPDQFVGAVRDSEGEAFGDHASYTEFLRLLKLDSPLIPINEEDALLRSLSHYKKAFEAQGGIEAGNGAMLTAYLIGELSRRLGYFDDAERHLDMARLSAHVAIIENGADKPRSALARHIAVLAERQSHLLYDSTSHSG